MQINQKSCYFLEWQTVNLLRSKLLKGVNTEMITTYKYYGIIIDENFPLIHTLKSLLKGNTLHDSQLKA